MTQDSNNQQNTEALKVFAFSKEELKDTADELNAAKDKRRSREVCLCGHGKSRHRKTTTGGVRCKPNARWCHCDQFRPVITTTNLNPFIRFSRGNGPLHALSQGIAGLMEKGGSFEWITGAAVCAGCGNTEHLIPVLVTKSGFRAEPDKDKLDDRKDVFLCEECNFKIQKNGNLL